MFFYVVLVKVSDSTLRILVNAFLQVKVNKKTARKSTLRIKGLLNYFLGYTSKGNFLDALI